MRTIKFRAWDKEKKEMIWFDGETPHRLVFRSNRSQLIWNTTAGEISIRDFVLMQFTGLKDKNGKTEIYECDIINEEGLIIGNIYEQKDKIHKRENNLVIPSITGKNWATAYQEAMGRGCKHS